MPLLQVRDLPEDLYETLSRVAKNEHRSIAQETVVLLREALNQKEERKARRLRILEEIEKSDINKTNAFPNPELLVREDRDR